MSLKLTRLDIEQLIARYNAELRKLQFQTNKIEATIYELKSLLNKVKDSEPQIKSKDFSSSLPSQRKRRKTGSYRLSAWDEFILETLKNTEKPLLSSELVNYAQQNEIGKDLAEKEVKAFISRSLHKLANRHFKILKIKHHGRGNAYSLIS